jgi:hypothetical protein
MGVWRISDGARRVSRIISLDFAGSPYAIPEYQINPDLGGLPAFLSLVKRAHEAGLAVIVDFVSNHFAIDSPLIDEDPSLFVLSNPEVRNQSVSDFFLHASGQVVAFGRDPYFPPWRDTAQLDYSNPDVRARMIRTLKWIASIADGVRCDMAMLVLKDQIRRQWYPLVSDEWFNLRMAHEFWAEAWIEIKKSKPEFITIAEVYWDREQYLMELGFDFCYEKKLYDGLVHRQPTLVRDRLKMPLDNLARSLFFIENHDEPRAATIFSRNENLSAAALLMALPGSVMIHEGQLEGLREQIPVQLTRAIHREEPDQTLREAYGHVAMVTAGPVFRKGQYELFETGVEGAVAFLRRDAERLVGYFGQVGELPASFADTTLDASALFSAAGSPRHLRLMNLVNREAVTILDSGRFVPRSLLPGFGYDDRFLMVEVTTS